MSRIEVRDFARRYSQTYVRLGQAANPKKLAVVYCSDVIQQDNGEVIARMTTERRGKSFNVMLPGPQKISFEFPNIGTFQFGKQAKAFVRNPERQWRRGICNNTARVYDFSFGMDGRNNLDFELLTAAYEAKQFSPEDAVKMLNKREAQSVAVFGNFVFAAAPHIEGYAVFYMLDMVGIIDTRGNVQRVFDELWATPLQELVNGING